MPKLRKLTLEEVVDLEHSEDIRSESYQNVNQPTLRPGSIHGKKYVDTARTNHQKARDYIRTRFGKES